MKTTQIINFAIALGMVVSVTGCMTSKVICTGPDTYSVSSSGAGIGTGGVRTNVYEAANKYCNKRGLVMMPVSIDIVPGMIGQHPPTADLTFRALPAGDAEIQRPRLERAPDHHEMITIQQR